MTPRRTYPKTTGPMDQWLESQGYYRKHTARDGTCLFRAVSEQVYKTQAFHQVVRKQCVEFIQRNGDKFEKFLEEPLEEYATRMMNTREWGGMLEIRAMALLYKCDIHVFEEVGKFANIATNYGFTRKIFLCFTPDNHYDSVYTKSYIVKAAFCQSIAYEILYKDVFKLSDVNYAVNKMLHDKTNRIQKERLINEDLLACGRFGFSMEISLESNREYTDGEEISNNVKELLAQGITPFPYKVAKALDPNIYRNIEFDIWNDYRRELKFGWYRNNGEFQVGVKCLVKLNPERNFHAHIQEMTPDKGPVIVFVEELGEKCTVPYDNLEPLPNDEKPQWPLPYKHCRQLSTIQQKSTLLALSELGGKWKKSKVAKSRKIKDPIHTPLSPRLQYNNKMNTAPPKYSAQHGNRFVSEQMGNQQMQVPFQNFNPENFNNMQNYNNVGMDIPLSGSMMMEQSRSANNPVVPQGMIPLTTSATVTNNHATNSTTQSTEITTTSSERCLSPVQQPDSTTDIPNSQKSVSDSRLHLEPSLCSQSASFSPPQFISLATFNSPPSLVNHAHISIPLPKPEPNATNPGNINPSNYFSDTSCSNSVSPQHVICNTGANMSYKSVPGGNDQQTRDINANMLFQPINFMAQKSMHMSGSDLPLSDLPTLRFYYNLGHEYFRLSCMYWPNSLQQTKANFVQQSITTSYNETPGYGNPVPTPNSVHMNENCATESTLLPADMYQIGQEVAQNFLLPNEQNIHLSVEEKKAVCLHNGSNGGNENVSWQSKQADHEVPRTMQTAFNCSGVASRIDKNVYGGKDERNQHGKSQQNAGRPNEQYEVQITHQSSQEIDNACGYATNGINSSVQNHTSNVISSGYNFAPSLPYAYTQLSPPLYNHAVVPFYFPVDNEQNIMPLQYYPQYAISSGVQLTPQEPTEPATSVTESQTGTSFTAGSVCQLQQSENGCFPSCAMYPPAPFMLQQPPAGIYPSGGNISVPRWVQPTSSSPHMTPTPYVFQSAM